jgi:hypothetical protein
VACSPHPNQFRALCTRFLSHYSSFFISSPFSPFFHS